MKALSMTQPMAWAVFNGKDVENRRWLTKYRGPLLIHASMNWNRDHYDWITANENRLGCQLPQQFVHGALIGIVDLVDCVRYHGSRWFFGPYGFVLANARGFQEPINYRGQLGLFNVPDEIVPVGASTEVR